jgi:hypothetical protein
VARATSHCFRWSSGVGVAYLGFFCFCFRSFISGSVLSAVRERGKAHDDIDDVLDSTITGTFPDAGLPSEVVVATVDGRFRLFTSSWRFPTETADLHHKSARKQAAQSQLPALRKRNLCRAGSESVLLTRPLQNRLLRNLATEVRPGTRNCLFGKVY